MATRKLLAAFAPPLAVCRYGCASWCAGPIALFWIGALAAIVYGLLGGPVGGAGVSWWTVGLGLVLWVLAAVWAEDTIKGVEEDTRDLHSGCEKRRSSVCRIVRPRPDESDPFEEVRKTRSP